MEKAVKRAVEVRLLVNTCATNVEAENEDGETTRSTLFGSIK